MIRRNSLAFPSGVKPGNDLNHPGSRGLDTSAICVNNNFVKIGGNYRQIVGSLTGTTRTTLGPIGPGISFASSGDICSFGNGPDIAQPVTMAGIFYTFSSFGQQQQIINNSGIGGAGVMLVIQSGGTFGVVLENVANKNSTLTAAASTPYFYAATVASTGITFVVRNLQTGQLFVDATTAGSPNSPGGTGKIVIGNDEAHSTTRYFQGTIAAASIAYSQLSKDELIAWAHDPWSFWYPDAPIQRSASIRFLRQRHYRFRTDSGAVDATPTWGSQEDSMVI